MQRGATLPSETEDFFAAARGRIDGHVSATFSLAGSARLHRKALGLDILCASFNVILAPLHAFLRLLTLLLRLVRLRHAAGILGRLHLVLPTRTARAVEEGLLTHVFALPAGPGRSIADRLTEVPPLRDDPSLSDSERHARAGRAAETLRAYTGTRSAVAEMTTALLTICFGAWVFHRLTPGMMTLAPKLADTFAMDAAIGNFPLGRGLGRLWYAAFPVDASPLAIVMIALALVVTAAIVTAFAGILADPVQTRLGVHQVRLRRLVSAVEQDMTGSGVTSFAAREHLYARAFDIVDIAGGLFRHFR
ncbi:hypothetical protein KM176_20870 [Pseudooceanicola sp. CBS1P-1]|uniref:Uncharacterized protein n=1 Tax=Pseudooceanicola albus TaxID=2692189 RepID=A0A6L7GAF1_9RHOB|nr:MULTISPECIES: DUF6635 family protein [Pseudooceanicola]MBT9386335.1 hypothetical protein [Pseudooceanicola endophyticus]MXN21174.1 hypothetical protein [Pseudooceanicola albus]